MAEGKDNAAGAKGAAAPSPEEEISKLKQDLEAAKAENEKVNKALDKSKELIQEQAERLATKEIQASSKDPVAMINKKHYRFLGKGNLTIQGKIVPAKEVLESQETLKYLLEIGSGLLVEIKAKKGEK